MKGLRFSKPKIGFGISKSYYLTVLAARAQLPSIASLVYPGATGEAIDGYGVPLAKGTGAEALQSPLARGAYAIATRDRKTVLRAMVLSKDEAGFDPEALLGSELAAQMSQEHIDRIRATWSLVQLSFESFDVDVSSSVDFLLRFAVLAAKRTDGTIADPIARRYFLPEELESRRGNLAADAALHISFERFETPEGWSVVTHGQAKFGLFELAMVRIRPDLIFVSELVLLQIAKRRLSGEVLEFGKRYRAGSCEFRAVEAGGGIPGLNPVTTWLLEPTHTDLNQALADWTDSEST